MTIYLDGTNGITTPSPVVLQGSTSGSITLAAPATGAVNTQTLVDTTGTLAPLVSGTAVSTPSGTSPISVTGIPAWVKRITVMFNNVSLDNIAMLKLTLGVGGVQETSGYSSVSTRLSTGASTATRTDSFGIQNASAATQYVGSIVLTLYDSSTNTWVASGVLADSQAANTYTVSGIKSLAGVLDSIALEPGGAIPIAAFDGGAFNIIYE